MGLSRALRRRFRRKDNPVAAPLAQMVQGVEEMAEALFHMALLSGQGMPTRDHVEATSKLLAESAMAPAAKASLKKGITPIEIEAYGSILKARVQLAFQERWAVLERQHAMLADASVARAH